MQDGDAAGGGAGGSEEEEEEQEDPKDYVKGTDRPSSISKNILLS